MSGTTSYTPLHDPERDALRYVSPLDQALRHAREVLAETATANIHNHDEMLRAAVGLEMRLRQLVAALDKEASR
ncbi:hypothetical protein [Streptomyces anulatus]|uniref:hypothetical protein n=1 Tax=Streptomyces anulatus TaxID=1892 RepID=UPI0004CA313F|nr:hypothetical protein [Streptomyces anulatus]